MLLLGEQGLKKDHIAAQLHASFPHRLLGTDDGCVPPLVKVDCSAAHSKDGFEALAVLLFGATDGQPCLLEGLEEGGGTLLLYNVHCVPEGRFRARLHRVLHDAVCAPDGGCCGNWSVIMTAEHPVPDLEQACNVIRVRL